VSVEFEEQWAQWHRKVYLFVGQRFDPVAGVGVDDVVQEVAIRAWKGMERGKFDGVNFKSWVLTIAARTVYDALKRVQHKAPEVPLGSDPDRDLGDTPWLAEVDGDLEAVGLDELAAQVLSEVTGTEREVLTSLFIRGLESREVQRERGIASCTVSNHVTRAANRLRRAHPDWAELVAS
jgi:RNA polymerase sigma factor (sigma-70 family)